MTPVALASAACWPPTHGNTSSSSSSSNNSGGSTPATDPPVIQSLNLNASATNQGAIYEIDGVITFTDDDDVVVAFDVEVPVLGKTYNFPTSDPSMSGYGVPISFTVSSDLPLTSAGPTQFVITLINKSGAASSPVAATVDLL
ncbi:MAG TPA: hypothetical protein VGI39_13670 [Polyangiaceae bacterium]